jgi:hypothetical protein
MVVKMVVRPIAKLSKEACAKFGRRRCAAMLCLDAAFKAHLRLDQLRGSRARDRCFKVEQLDLP